MTKPNIQVATSGSISLLILAVIIFSGRVLADAAPLTKEFDVEEVNGVYILDSFNFDEIVFSQPFIIVKMIKMDQYYRRYIEFDYEEAANEAARYGIPFALIDINEADDIGIEYNVYSVYSILIFKEGHHFEYLGPETSIEMVEQLKKFLDHNWNIKDDESVIVTDENFEKTYGKAELGFLLLYNSKIDYHYQNLVDSMKNISSTLKYFYDIPVGISDVYTNPKLKSLKKPHSLSAEIFMCVYTNCYQNSHHNYKTHDIFATAINTMHGGREIKTQKQIETYRAIYLPQSTAIYISFLDKDDEDEYDEFQHALFAFHNSHHIYYSYDLELRKKYGCNEACLRVIYPDWIKVNEDEERILKAMPKGAQMKNETAVFDFIRKYSLSIIGYKASNHPFSFHYFRDHYPYIVVYGDFSMDYKAGLPSKTTLEYRQKLAKFALKHPEYQFATSSYSGMMVDLFIGFPQTGVYFAIFDHHELHYVYNNTNPTFEEIDQFIKDYENGKLIPIEKSDQMALIPNDMGLKIIGMSNFVQELSKKGHDTLLMMYVDFDYKYITFSHEIRKLTEILLQNKNLVFAKIHRNKNMLPREYRFQNKFTMALIIDGDLWNPIFYHDDPTSFKVIPFLEKHSKTFKHGWPDHISDEL